MVMNDDLCNDIVKHIKTSIKNRIDAEYTDYKLQCLKDLDYKLELNRNKVIDEVLNGIDVCVANNGPISLEPIINIRVSVNQTLRMGDL